jgi:hypothetical protein
MTVSRIVLKFHSGSRVVLDVAPEKVQRHIQYIRTKPGEVEHTVGNVSFHGESHLETVHFRYAYRDTSADDEPRVYVYHEEDPPVIVP